MNGIPTRVCFFKLMNNVRKHSGLYSDVITKYSESLYFNECEVTVYCIDDNSDYENDMISNIFKGDPFTSEIAFLSRMFYLLSHYNEYEDGDFDERLRVAKEKRNFKDELEKLIGDRAQRLQWKKIFRNPMDELKCFWQDRKDYLEEYNLL